MKELKRSHTDRMIAGVCGGIGEYLEIDPSVIRLVWVVVTVFTIPIGILAYVLAWLILPEEAPPATGAGTTPASSMSTGAGTIIEIEPDQDR